MPHEGDCPMLELEMLRHAAAPKEKPINIRRLQAQIAFLRENFRNDGVEGETVHAVCNAAEELLGKLLEARDQLLKVALADTGE